MSGQCLDQESEGEATRHVGIKVRIGGTNRTEPA